MTVIGCARPYLLRDIWPQLVFNVDMRMSIAAPDWRCLPPPQTLRENQIYIFHQSPRGHLHDLLADFTILPEVPEIVVKISRKLTQQFIK